MTKANLQQEPEEPTKIDRDESNTQMATGFFDRLSQGGFERIIKGYDLYFALAITAAAIIIQIHTNVNLVQGGLIANGTPLAISLLAFILVGVSVLVSFSDERFLGLLKELEIYNTILFSFEYSIYLTLFVSSLGIAINSYSNILIQYGIFTKIFFIYLFFFLYMVLAIANLVSVIVTIGSRKARIALIE